MHTALQKLQDAIRRRHDDGSFIKMTLANYKGSDDLKNIYVKKITIKDVPHLSVTYRHQRNDIVKNYVIDEAIDVLASFCAPDGFRSATLFSLEQDEEWLILPNGKATFKTRKPSQKALLPEQHDRAKQRKITGAGDKVYLHALRITDENGQVYKNAQDKYKQINHFIEILSTRLTDLAKDRPVHVTDMGSGKGYLTFALYDYLTTVLAQQAHVTGVEYRQDMVDLCNGFARDSGFDGLRFQKGAIADYQPDQLDVLIALHACDTATDDAIAKGIRHNAELIVVAPCCHKQIRQEMIKASVPPAAQALGSLTQYGLFLERQAEMVTDTIRTLVLEHFGYQIKVIDFIADQHTPKNVMIIAQKKKGKSDAASKALASLHEIKTFFGIAHHHLETEMGLIS